jgi:hypothetical protein
LKKTGQAANTLVPRLAASSADLSRIFFVRDVIDGKERRAFDPAKDIGPLKQAIEAAGGRGADVRPSSRRHGARAESIPDLSIHSENIGGEHRRKRRERRPEKSTRQSHCNLTTH